MDSSAEEPWPGVEGAPGWAWNGRRAGRGRGAGLGVEGAQGWAWKGRRDGHGRGAGLGVEGVAGCEIRGGAAGGSFRQGDPQLRQPHVSSGERCPLERESGRACAFRSLKSWGSFQRPPGSL